MNIKLFFVLFLATALLVSVSEAGKDRRKKQKQKERNEEDDNNEETTGGKAMEESGKAREEKERSSVLEKQAEKKSEDDESSSEEDEDEKDKADNSTVIIRKKREVHAIEGLKELTFPDIRLDEKHLQKAINDVISMITRLETSIEARKMSKTRAVRHAHQNDIMRDADEGRILPTDEARFKRDTTTTQIQKSREINDGAQLPIVKKPAATASPN
ncbi:hypothetical protein CAEBREN_08621 [Caenorhabditis brenneri]|uniref:Uncharacterized protein n=1 Tax=Caenorhabditis brenneri TaxID=135651 RepID=G0MHU7_CAEBE|nr:hypothetical protein CAEBREN_08621 [Caenorhabditis brenneri]